MNLKVLIEFLEKLSTGGISKEDRGKFYRRLHDVANRFLNQSSLRLKTRLHALTALTAVFTNVALDHGQILLLKEAENLLHFLFIEISKILIGVEFLQLEDDNLTKRLFKKTISDTSELLKSIPNQRFFEALNNIVQTEWSHPTLLALLRGDDVDKETVLAYVKDVEHEDIVRLRIEALLASDCEDLAQKLISQCLTSDVFMNNPGILLKRFQFLYKSGNLEEFHQLCSKTRSSTACEVLSKAAQSNCFGANPSAALLLAQTFYLIDWVQPVDLTYTKFLLRNWMVLESHIGLKEEFGQALDKVLAVAHTAKQIVIFIDVAEELFDFKFANRCSALGLHALRQERHRLDCARLYAKDDEETDEANRSLAEICYVLVRLFRTHPQMHLCCLLSWFYLCPSENGFYMLERSHTTTANQLPSNLMPPPTIDEDIYTKLYHAVQLLRPDIFRASCQWQELKPVLLCHMNRAGYKYDVGGNRFMRSRQKSRSLVTITTQSNKGRNVNTTGQFVSEFKVLPKKSNGLPSEVKTERGSEEIVVGETSQTTKVQSTSCVKQSSKTEPDVTTTTSSKSESTESIESLPPSVSSTSLPLSVSSTSLPPSPPSDPLPSAVASSVTAAASPVVVSSANDSITAASASIVMSGNDPTNGELLSTVDGKKKKHEADNSQHSNDHLHEIQSCHSVQEEERLKDRDDDDVDEDDDDDTDVDGDDEEQTSVSNQPIREQQQEEDKQSSPKDLHNTYEVGNEQDNIQPDELETGNNDDDVRQSNEEDTKHSALQSLPDDLEATVLQLSKEDSQQPNEETSPNCNSGKERSSDCFLVPMSDCLTPKANVFSQLHSDDTATYANALVSDANALVSDMNVTGNVTFSRENLCTGSYPNDVRSQSLDMVSMLQQSQTHAELVLLVTHSQSLEPSGCMDHLVSENNNQIVALPMKHQLRTVWSDNISTCDGDDNGLDFVSSRLVSSINAFGSALSVDCVEESVLCQRSLMSLPTTNLRVVPFSAKPNVAIGGTESEVARVEPSAAISRSLPGLSTELLPHVTESSTVKAINGSTTDIVSELLADIGNEENSFIRRQLDCTASDDDNDVQSEKDSLKEHHLAVIESNCLSKKPLMFVDDAVAADVRQPQSKKNESSECSSNKPVFLYINDKDRKRSDEFMAIEVDFPNDLNNALLPGVNKLTASFAFNNFEPNTEASVETDEERSADTGTLVADETGTLIGDDDDAICVGEKARWTDDEILASEVDSEMALALTVDRAEHLLKPQCTYDQTVDVTALGDDLDDFDDNASRDCRLLAKSDVSLKTQSILASDDNAPHALGQKASAVYANVLAVGDQTVVVEDKQGALDNCAFVHDTSYAIFDKSVANDKDSVVDVKTSVKKGSLAFDYAPDVDDKAPHNIEDDKGPDNNEDDKGPDNNKDDKAPDNNEDEKDGSTAEEMRGVSPWQDVPQSVLRSELGFDRRFDPVNGWKLHQQQKLEESHSDLNRFPVAAIGTNDSLFVTPTNMAFLRTMFPDLAEIQDRSAVMDGAFSALRSGASVMHEETAKDPSKDHQSIELELTNIPVSSDVSVDCGVDELPPQLKVCNALKYECVICKKVLSSSWGHRLHAIRVHQVDCVDELSPDKGYRCRHCQTLVVLNSLPYKKRTSKEAFCNCKNQLSRTKRRSLLLAEDTEHSEGRSVNAEQQLEDVGIASNSATNDKEPPEKWRRMQSVGTEKERNPGSATNNDIHHHEMVIGELQVKQCISCSSGFPLALCQNPSDVTVASGRPLCSHCEVSLDQTKHCYDDRSEIEADHVLLLDNASQWLQMNSDSGLSLMDSQNGQFEMDSKSGQSQMYSKNGQSEMESKNGQSDTDSKNGQSDINSENGQSVMDSKSGQYEMDSKSGQSAIDSKSGQSELDSRSGQLEMGSKSGQSEMDSKSGQSEMDSKNGQSDLDLNGGPSEIESKSGQTEIDSKDVQSEMDSKNGQSEMDSRSGKSEMDSKDIQSEMDSKDVQSEMDSKSGQSEMNSKNGQSDLDLNGGQSEMDSKNGQSEMDSKNVQSEMDSKDVQSEMDSKSGQSEMDSKSGQSEMNSKNGESDLDLNGGQSDMDSKNGQSEMDSKDVQSEMHSKGVQSEIDSKSGQSEMDSSNGHSDLDLNGDQSEMDPWNGQSELDSKDAQTEMDSKSGHTELDSKDVQSEMDSKSGLSELNSNDVQAQMDSMNGQSDVDLQNGQFGMDTERDHSELDSKNGQSVMDSKNDQSEMDSNSGQFDMDSQDDQSLIDLKNTQCDMDSKDDQSEADSKSVLLEMNSDQSQTDSKNSVSVEMLAAVTETESCPLSKDRSFSQGYTLEVSLAAGQHEISSPHVGDPAPSAVLSDVRVTVPLPGEPEVRGQEPEVKGQRPAEEEQMNSKETLEAVPSNRMKMAARSKNAKDIGRFLELNERAMPQRELEHDNAFAQNDALVTMVTSTAVVCNQSSYESIPSCKIVVDAVYAAKGSIDETRDSTVAAAEVEFSGSLVGMGIALDSSDVAVCLSAPQSLILNDDDTVIQSADNDVSNADVSCEIVDIKRSVDSEITKDTLNNFHCMISTDGTTTGLEGTKGTLGSEGTKGTLGSEGTKDTSGVTSTSTMNDDHHACDKIAIGNMNLRASIASNIRADDQSQMSTIIKLTVSKRPSTKCTATVCPAALKEFAQRSHLVSDGHISVLPSANGNISLLDHVLSKVSSAQKSNDCVSEDNLTNFNKMANCATNKPNARSESVLPSLNSQKGTKRKKQMERSTGNNQSLECNGKRPCTSAATAKTIEGCSLLPGRSTNRPMTPIGTVNASTTRSMKLVKQLCNDAPKDDVSCGWKLSCRWMCIECRELFSSYSCWKTHVQSGHSKSPIVSGCPGNAIPSVKSCQLETVSKGGHATMSSLDVSSCLGHFTRDGTGQLGLSASTGQPRVTNKTSSNTMSSNNEGKIPNATLPNRTYGRSGAARNAKCKANAVHSNIVPCTETEGNIREKLRPKKCRASSEREQSIERVQQQTSDSEDFFPGPVRFQGKTYSRKRQKIGWND